MELIVVGAGPAYTNRQGAASSGYLLRANGGGATGPDSAGHYGPTGAGAALLLLDLGQGAFSNLAAMVEPSRLQAVVVSHLHPDHFVDLVPLRHYLRWEFDPPRRVAVIGPAGLEERLDGLMAEPGFAAVTLDFAKAEAGMRRIGSLDLETRPVAHTEESYALRVSAAGGFGPGLVYSGDCGRADDLEPLIRPGDVLLAEASFGAGPVAPGAAHITAADAARIAARCGASRLLLTHILAGRSRADTLAAARALFTGPVQLVTEGDRFEV